MPNPSRHGLTVFFTLPSSKPGTLELIDLSGRLVRSRDVGSFGPGSHQLDMARGAKIATGVYWIRLNQAGLTRVTKAVLLD